MKVLITGANGFLGSNTIKQLLKLNHEILAFSKNFNNITEILKDIKFIEFDEKNYFPYESAIIDFSADIIINFAWDGGNNYQDINSFDQFYKNIPLSLSLLEIINKQTKKPKFIGVGSFAEYGIIESKSKEDKKEDPINFYGLAKKQVKQITELFCTQNNIEYNWIRPCYVYGPGDVSTRLIPSIINKLLVNEEIILNSCEIIIDYLYIDDFCLGIIALIESIAPSGVYNICSSKEYVLKDIITYIQKNITTDIKIIFDKSLDRKLSSKYVCGSNKKIKSKTSWTPQIKIDEGIKNVINYYKTIIKK
jgi:nucleoside-diphosphate-sugar epimerase